MYMQNRLKVKSLTGVGFFGNCTGTCGNGTGTFGDFGGHMSLPPYSQHCRCGNHRIEKKNNTASAATGMMLGCSPLQCLFQ